MHDDPASGVRPDRVGPTRTVAFVSHSYTPALDGTAVLIRRLAEGMASRGIRVHVITSDRDDPGGFRSNGRRLDAPSVEEIGGVTVHRLPSAWWISAASRYPAAVVRRISEKYAEPLSDIYLGPLLVGLSKTLRRIAPDAIYASAFPFMHMHAVTRIGRKMRVPVLLHGALHPADTWSFDRRSIRRTIARASMYCANTEYEARYVEDWGMPRNRIRVIGVGVDLHSTEPPRRRTSPPTVLYFGHIAERKGVDVLIDAIPGVMSKEPSARFVIAGKTTDDTEQLRARAARTPGGDTIRWVQDVSEAEKQSLMGDASVLVYPSRGESFGIVFLEGWSASLPVVGCDSGAVADVIDHERTGLLVPLDEPDGLADAICRLLGDPAAATEMGLAGWHMVRDRFTWDRTVDRALSAIDAARPTR